MTSDVFKQLEDALIKASMAMRDDLCELEDCPTYFDFVITVGGRTMDGDLEITFALDGNSYSKTTKGGNLDATFEEYKRRYGWNKRNQALCLPKVVDAHGK